MPAEIVTVGFCAQYYSTWAVKSGSTPGTYYTVTLNGTGAPSCTCPAFKYSKNGDCKHIRLIWEHGCLYNPQWKPAGPNDHAKHGAHFLEHDTHIIVGQTCPGCGGPVVPVRIAV